MTGLGSKDLARYIENCEKLSKTAAIKAKCSECTANYSDGRIDCEIPECPLHPFMPYKGKKGNKKEEN